MITKEQALVANYFKVIELSPRQTFWRRNGKTKTWKTRPDDYKIPVKYGLYTYGYITQDNAHLFEAVSD